MQSRRAFLGAAASAPFLSARGAHIRVGVMDGIVGKPCDPAAVETAKRLGFEGLQVTLGRKPVDGHLVMANTHRQAAFLAASAKLKFPLISTYIDILHANCLKNDREAVKWVAEGIRITRSLNSKILMLVFFGDCALNSAQDMDAVVGPLKEVAPEAERAGITLGFENTISAEDDARILDKVKSKALKIYYDIGNATNMKGFDPAKEIRFLGRDRICQFHFKDKGYLGEGKVDVRGALDAIQAIGWQGYVVLETGAPSKNVSADLKRNLDYVRKLL